MDGTLRLLNAGRVAKLVQALNRRRHSGGEKLNEASVRIKFMEHFYRSLPDEMKPKLK